VDCRKPFLPSPRMAISQNWDMAILSISSDRQFTQSHGLRAPGMVMRGTSPAKRFYYMEVIGAVSGAPVEQSAAVE
jgi:hypothetical protein